MNPRISEPAFNVALGNILGTKHPRWRNLIGIEQTGVLKEGAGLKPDIVIRHLGGLPVVVETEYSPGTYGRERCPCAAGQNAAKGWAAY